MLVLRLSRDFGPLNFYFFKFNLTLFSLNTVVFSHF